MILWHKRITPFFWKKNGDHDIWRSPVTFSHTFSLQIYATPWRLLIFIRKSLWRRVLEAHKKYVPLKSYYLKIRIDSVNQILRNKEKVIQAYNINILTEITDWKIPYVYIHVYQVIKNCGAGLSNSPRHADNTKYFSGLSLTRNRRKTHMFYLVMKVGILRRCSCLEKGNFIMINEFKCGQTWKISPLSSLLYSTVILFLLTNVH